MGIGEEVKTGIESGQDVIEIKRDHATGRIDWRFDCLQTQPIALLFHVLWLQMAYEGGWADRFARIEARLSKLEAREG